MKPMLFSTPMVQAIQKNLKTQTRRIVKPQPVIDEDSGYKYWDNLMFDIHDTVLEDLYMPDHCKHQIGDVIWVRETWQHTRELNIHPTDENYGFVYKADGQPWEDYEGWKWRPSIFMPKEACRLFLKIVDIRVERLNAISKTDAIAEGIDRWVEERMKSKPTHYAVYFHEPGDESFYSSCPILSFEGLWKKINGVESWNENPFVWVYEFEITTKP